MSESTVDKMVQPTSGFCEPDCPVDACRNLGGCAWPNAYDFDPFPPDLGDALDVLRAVVRHCAKLASYEIRPFDMARDRRRWRWQRPGCSTCRRSGRPRE